MIKLTLPPLQGITLTHDLRAWHKIDSSDNVVPNVPSKVVIEIAPGDLDAWVTKLIADGTVSVKLPTPPKPPTQREQYQSLKRVLAAARYWSTSRDRAYNGSHYSDEFMRAIGVLHDAVQDAENITCL